MLDPLDILTNIEDVIPYYQPIFSAEEQKVIGYEVLGRIKVESEVKSLGPFFLIRQFLKNTRKRLISR